MALEKEPCWLEKSMNALGSEDLAGFDALVHLASVGVSPKTASWEDMFYWNVTVPLRLLERYREAGGKRVVAAGTFAEYGRASERYEFIPPDAPLEPTTGYAASKAAFLVGASAYAIEYGIEFSYQRIFSVYGEGQYEKNFWPALRRAAVAGVDFPMTAGEQVRDYVAVEYVAEKLLHQAVREWRGEPGPLVANLASGTPITMRQFAETWWKRWEGSGKLLLGALPYRKNEPMRYVPLINSERDY